MKTPSKSPTTASSRVHTPAGPVVAEANGKAACRHRKKPPTEHLFAILAEQSPDAVLRIGLDGSILYANARAAEWFQLPAEAITGSNIHDLCRRVGCGDMWSRILDETSSSGLPQRNSTSIHTPSGIRVLDIHTSRETDGVTEFDAVIATIRDATNQHVLEHQLFKANQRLLYHMNNSPLAVIEWDNSGTCLSWNDEAERLFGWTRQEANQMFDDFLPLIHREDRPRFLKTFDELRQGRETSAFLACRALSSTNSVSSCEWYLSSLLDDSGKSLGILGLVNDVTERELSERKLQTLISTLEKKIELRSKLLRAARQKLQRENLVRRQLERDMIGISERAHRRIGHDLHDGICQELAGLRFAIAAMAASSPEGDPRRDRLLRIEDAVLRAMHETRLLARGLAPLELENGDLNSALRELARNTSRLHDTACRIHWHGPKTRFPPETATHLFRIAQEALHNAIHHGSATQVDIRLDITPNSLQLTVEDNGTGLPESPKPLAPGRGMGTKIMQHRASVIDGTVSLAPRPGGQGTQLVCSCPRKNPVRPCQPRKNHRSKSKSSKTTR